MRDRDMAMAEGYDTGLLGVSDLTCELQEDLQGLDLLYCPRVLHPRINLTFCTGQNQQQP